MVLGCQLPGRAYTSSPWHVGLSFILAGYTDTDNLTKPKFLMHLPKCFDSPIAWLKEHLLSEREVVDSNLGRTISKV